MRFKMGLPIVLFAAFTLVAQAALAITSHHAAIASDSANQRDAEIIATLITVNNNEIMLAQEVIGKTKNKDVKQYAKMLKSAHKENLKKTLKVAKSTGLTPVVTVKVKNLQDHGKKKLATLKSLQGAALDKTYVDAMVKGHQAVLVLFDTNLLKNVNNPKLKAHLNASRPHIQSHLQQGEMILKNLK
jgi:putative membrane protein